MKPIKEQAESAEGGEIKLHRYLLGGGWTILAGKTDEDNDQLSMRIARQNDFWFHVRGMTGSHVILQSEKDTIPNKNLIKTAAQVAAWYSKGRSGGKVAVSYTRAKYVSKKRGDKSGTVRIRNERILLVRPALPEPESAS
jgi:predicted ribosome quality control (RQC) complex YloA/Tae2 family protein